MVPYQPAMPTGAMASGRSMAPGSPQAHDGHHRRRTTQCTGPRLALLAPAGDRER
jgi:hypothetical protein